MSSVLVSTPGAARTGRRSAARLLVAGGAAFAVAFGGWLAYLAMHREGWTLNMIDLSVYMDGGKIIRHVHGFYDPGHASPLYDWTRHGKDSLAFTYTPFAAVAFTVISLMSPGVATPVWTILNFTALLAALWFTSAGLGVTDRRTKAGMTLLGAAAAIWTEPVFRTIYLGQINLVLMALILWDLTQPDVRKNKGFVTGVAAGIKLVPLIFIPYLLMTRKFRQAAMTVAGFAATLAVGFAVIPKDSVTYWFDGLFAQGGRTGFTGWLGNQSLDGLITRLSGSINAAKPAWLAASVVAVVAGIAAAKLLDDDGYLLPAILVTALTGDLVSPISWDHHWVWLAPGLLTLGYYAVRAWQRRQEAQAAVLGAAALVTLIIFACWPVVPGGVPVTAKNFNFYLGIIWGPPNSNPFLTYYKHGDQPQYVEYHWHGVQLLTGNAYILAGLAAFLALVLFAVTRQRFAVLRKGR